EGMLKFLIDAREELADALTADEERSSTLSMMPEEEAHCTLGFPHARLSSERAQEFGARLGALLDEFATADPDPDGQVYALSMAYFLAPPYLQSNGSTTAFPAIRQVREKGGSYEYGAATEREGSDSSDV